MEQRFENCYLTTRKMLSEFARRYSVGPRPLVVALTLPVILLSTLYAMSPAGDPELRRFISILVGIYAVVFFMPQIYARSVLKGSKKQNDGVLPETRVVFGDENIQMFEGMVHLTIEYHKIRKAVRLKHSYALFNGKRTAVLIDPEGFTVGDFKAFKAFLREKCPGIQIAE